MVLKMRSPTEIGHLKKELGYALEANHPSYLVGGKQLRLLVNR